MTRFARYSTKGIKKPPLEATPWSELAPPAAKKHPAVESNGTVGTENALSALKGLENKAEIKVPNEAMQIIAVSASKRKTQKNAKNHLSVPMTPSVDIHASKSVLWEGFEINGKEAKDGDEQANSPKGQHSKKKKKRFASDVTSPIGAQTHEDGLPTSDIVEMDNETNSPKKGKKRKVREGILLKKTKKRLSPDDALTDVPHASEEHQTEDSPEQLSEPSKPTPKIFNGSDGPSNKKKKQKQRSRKLPGPAASGTPLLTEGPLMTQFEGYWVRRRAVPRLERIRAELTAAITDPQMLKREMKKRKRAEHRLLLSQLAARGARRSTSAAARLQDQTDAAEDGLEPAASDADDPGDDEDMDDDVDSKNSAVRREQPPLRRTVADDRNPGGGAPREERMVKFDGVWMTADAVGRLKELRRQLKLQRVSDVVLKQTMKTARRREEMKRKRDAKRVCLGCRQPGHFISECPRRAAGVKAPVTGLCFRCGSTEHRLSECRRPADAGKLPYAVCFVCGQTGHLSRDCALNPNGVYPRGGACKVCHRRDHLADDCPEKREEEAAATAPRLTTISDGALEDDYQHDFREAQTPAAAAAAPPGRKPRLVKF